MGESEASKGIEKITDDTLTFTFEIDLGSKLHYYTPSELAN